jgi:hypothetical protein
VRDLELELFVGAAYALEAHFGQVRDDLFSRQIDAGELVEVVCVGWDSPGLEMRREVLLAVEPDDLYWLH